MTRLVEVEYRGPYTRTGVEGNWYRRLEFLAAHDGSHPDGPYTVWFWVPEEAVPEGLKPGGPPTRAERFVM